MTNYLDFSPEQILELSLKTKDEMSKAETLRMPEDANISPDSSSSSSASSALKTTTTEGGEPKFSCLDQLMLKVRGKNNELSLQPQASSSSASDCRMVTRGMTIIGSNLSYSNDSDFDRRGRGEPPSEFAKAQEQFQFYTQSFDSTRYGRRDHTFSDGYSPPGMCGLNNLGNTCFMNSMLQCLSVSEPFTNFFLEDREEDKTPAYIYDINNGNLLSSNGRLAHAYAALTRAMWSGKFKDVSPIPLKKFLSDRAPQFIGFAQHDSQELMSFLLDNLLEDLCRVKWPKPKGKGPLPASEPEAVQAEHTWNDYLARNSSIVTDVFSGQFRSKLTCNICGEISIAFDPFTNVSIPIPLVKEKQVSVVFFPDGNKALYVKFFVPATEILTPSVIAQKIIEVVYDSSSTSSGSELNRIPTPCEIVVSLCSRSYIPLVLPLPANVDAWNLFLKYPDRNDTYQFFARTVYRKKKALTSQLSSTSSASLAPLVNNTELRGTDNCTSDDEENGGGGGKRLKLTLQLASPTTRTLSLSLSTNKSTIDQNSFIMNENQHDDEPSSSSSSSFISKKRTSPEQPSRLPSTSELSVHLLPPVSPPSFPPFPPPPSPLIPGVDFIQIAFRSTRHREGYSYDFYNNYDKYTLFGDSHVLSLQVINGSEVKEGSSVLNEDIHKEISRRFSGFLPLPANPNKQRERSMLSSGCYSLRMFTVPSNPDFDITS
jgi:hypothetical protein